MNDVSFVYSYIVKGVNQKTLANSYQLSEKQVKEKLKSLGINKTNDGNWAGDDFGKFKRLEVVSKFTKQQVMSFIEDYIKNYADDPETDFEGYLVYKFNDDLSTIFTLNYANKSEDYEEDYEEDFVDFCESNTNRVDSSPKYQGGQDDAELLVFFIVIIVALFLFVKFFGFTIIQGIKLVLAILLLLVVIAYIRIKKRER